MLRSPSGALSGPCPAGCGGALSSGRRPVTEIVPFKDLLLVMLGGLFGWMLGKLPERWVHMIIALAILLLLIVLRRV